MLAPLAAVAGLLVAAERRGEVGAGSVEVHVAGAQARGFRFVRLSEVEPVTTTEDVEYTALTGTGSSVTSGLD